VSAALSDRQRYSRVPRPRLSKVRRTVSFDGMALYAWLQANEHLGPIPGLLIAGAATIGEFLQLPTGKVKRLLAELERHGWVRCDLRAPIVWVVHAIADDPAANRNVVTFSWAPRVRELPDSPLVSDVKRAIHDALSVGHPDTLNAWLEQFPTTNPSPLPFPPTVPGAVGGIPQPEPQPEPQPTPQPSPDNGFNEFWVAYPRKDGKADAIKAWSQAKVDDLTRTRILTDLRSRTRSAEWTKSGGQFVPMPATYLRGRRWEDEGTVTAAVDRQRWCDHEPRCDHDQQHIRRLREERIARDAAQHSQSAETARQESA
jgi:hypothetical protein